MLALFILQPLSQLLSQITLILINLFKLFQDLINPVLQWRSVTSFVLLANCDVPPTGSTVPDL